MVIYGCESWTIKKAKHWRIDAFELWCWRRLLRVPWAAGRYNQSILKEISPEYSLEGLMLKLKLQSFGQSWCKELSHWKRHWCWERLKAGERDDRGWDGFMAPLIQWTWVWASSRRWWRTRKPGMLQSMRSQSDWVTEQQKIEGKKVNLSQYQHTHTHTHTYTHTHTHTHSVNLLTQNALSKCYFFCVWEIKKEAKFLMSRKWSWESKSTGSSQKSWWGHEIWEAGRLTSLSSWMERGPQVISWVHKLSLD